MSSEKFTPKKRGPKPKTEVNVEAVASKEASPLKTKDDLARERRQKRKEALKRPGAYKGQRLWAPQVPGYEFRWVIDQGGRIDFVEGEGYYFVEKDMFPGLDGVLNSDAGKKISQTVNNKDGKPTRQYLMVRPADIREETDHEKEQRLRRRDQGLVTLADNRGIGQERTSSGGSAVYAPENSVFEV